MGKIITGSDIKFQWITTPEHYQKLKEFAKSFGHTAENPKYPMVAAYTPGKDWHSYHQIYRDPVVFNAFHTNPEICPSRMVVETMKAFMGWVKLQYGGGITCSPIDSPTFTPEVMQKLGFRDMNARIWETSA